MILNDYPKTKNLKSIIFMLENGKNIESKQYKLIKDFSYSNINNVSNNLISLFDDHNTIVSIKNTVSTVLDKKKKEEINKKVADKKAKREHNYLKEVKQDIEILNHSFSNNSKKEVLNLTKYYYDLLKYPENINRVEYELINVITKNQYKVIKELKLLLENDYKENRSIINLEENEYQSNIINVSSKLMMLNHVLQCLSMTDSPLDKGDESMCNQLFFAERISGKKYIEDDLKEIPNEYLESAYKLLQALKDNDFNGVENKKFTNNNSINDLWQVKVFKVRLYYKLLGKNNIQVLMLSMKKSDADRHLYSRLKYRGIKTYNSYQMLKSQIAENNVSQVELENEELVYSRLIEKVKSRVK